VQCYKQSISPDIFTHMPINVLPINNSLSFSRTRESDGGLLSVEDEHNVSKSSSRAIMASTTSSSIISSFILAIHNR